MNTGIRTVAHNSMDTPPGTEEEIELSVLVTVHSLDQASTIRELYAECTDELKETDVEYELIFVVEREEQDVVDWISRLKKEGGPRTKVIVLGRHCGSATALSIGVDYAAGKTVLNIPAFLRVEPGALTSLISEIQDHDLVLLRRSDRGEGAIRGMIRKLLGLPLKLVLGEEAYDLRPGILIFRREVVQNIEIFGDKDRYLPILARRLGYKVKVPKKERAERRDGQGEKISIHGGVSQFLDLLSVFFLTEFTQKPLRFFGFFGLASFSAGGGICVYLAIQRLFMGVPLADKPMLLLGVLLIVLGVLLLSIGLIGEMIIFTKGKVGSEEIVERVVD